MRLGWTEGYAGTVAGDCAPPGALGFPHTDHVIDRVQRCPRVRSAVTVRSISSPRPGWSLSDAVRLAEQGYALEQVERLTGYAAAHVKAQLARP